MTSFYDGQPIASTALSDLDTAAVRRYLVSSGREDVADDLPRLLRAWRLVDGSSPTVAGVVLFGLRPQQVLESARVVVASFSGAGIGDDLLDGKDLTGGLFDVVRQIERFLDLHLGAPRTGRGFEPERVPEIPRLALREAVVNALVHRDYSIPTPVRVFVLADRVEVHTPGRPHSTVDVEAMRAGVHVPRNPYIYSRVADAQFATGAGTGIRRMVRLLRESGDRELGIAISEAEVVLSLPRPRHNGED